MGQAQNMGDLALLNPGLHERQDLSGKRAEPVGQVRLRRIAAMRLPRITEIDEVGVEPVLPAAMAQQIEEPFLEASRNDPGHAWRGRIARGEHRVAAAGPPKGKVDAYGLDV